jgi:hypothetical protein
MVHCVVLAVMLHCVVLTAMSRVGMIEGCTGTVAKQVLSFRVLVGSHTIAGLSHMVCNLRAHSISQSGRKTGVKAQSLLWLSTGYRTMCDVLCSCTAAKAMYCAFNWQYKVLMHWCLSS